MTDVTFAALSDDEIFGLLGKGRARNAYLPKIEIFVGESDEPAINVKDTWPVEFGQKEPSTLYQGFLAAIKKAGLEDTILVKRDGEKVYLWHNERIAAWRSKLNGKAK